MNCNRSEITKEAQKIVTRAKAIHPEECEGGKVHTPILRLFHEHQAILLAANEYHYAGEHIRTESDIDAELDRLFYQHSDRIEAELKALPCTCAADFAAKMIIDTVRGEVFSDWETGALWVEARALTGCEA